MTENELYDLLYRLKEWAEFMGGFESKVWEDLDRALAEHANRERGQ